MRIVEGPRGDDSRTAFVLAPDLPRHSIAPVWLRAGAWCSLLLSAGWALAVVVLALSATALSTGDVGAESPTVALLALLAVPFYGIVFSAILLRSPDAIAAYVALWPLHILALPVNLVGVFADWRFGPSLALNAATLLCFWWEKRWWDRF